MISTTTRRSNSPIPVALLVATAMLLPACSDDDDPTPPGCTASFCEPYLELTSPGNVLTNLKLAYESRDAEMYALLFAPDFVFEFAPEDVSRGYTPADWLLPDELESAGNMFDDATIDRIEMTSFIILAPRAALASDSLPSIAGIQVITIDAVRLSVFTRNSQGEVLELPVPGEQAVFFFRQDTVDGDLRWRLVRWRDKPTGGWPGAGPATEESSWGLIKALFL